jgi:hypothetical protein
VKLESPARAEDGNRCEKILQTYQRTEQIVITPHARLWVFPLLTLSVPLFVSTASAQTDSFHILLTNDDGIESQGIQVLAEKLRAVGEVHLIAPCGERSGSSMSLALRDELQLRPVQRDGNTLGHCVNTTPAGAVLLAITTLAPDTGFDLVVSGINRGANVGNVSHGSGTVGAAMMGTARFVAGFVEGTQATPRHAGDRVLHQYPAGHRS